MITLSRLDRLERELLKLVKVLAEVKYDNEGNPLLLKTDLNKITKKFNDIKKEVITSRHGKKPTKKRLKNV